MIAALSPSIPLHAQPDAQQQMIAADRGLLEAMGGPKPDTEKYEQGLAADFLDIEQGSSHSRQEVVEQMKMIRAFSFQYRNPKAVLLSPTSGFVVAEVGYTAINNGSGIQNRVLSTTVFSLEQGRWVAHLQMTEPMNAASKATVVPDSDPTLIQLRSLAAQVEEKVQIPGYAPFAAPKVMLDAGTGVSYYTFGNRTVHAAQFADLPAPMQDIWKQWSSYTTDEPDGKALFDDMFHRFFFVHELGHWVASEVIAGLPEKEMVVVGKNEAGNKWESETTANRIAVAWYREHDPQYLARLVADFRGIQAHLPDPVPAGMDKKTYFTQNYAKLGKDPMAYGWYQLQMVLVVYDEPVQSFQQVLKDLPAKRYE
jgi:hypothetical protein